MRPNFAIRLAAAAGVALGLAAAPAHAQFVNIVSGGTTGVYYPLGQSLESIFAAALPKARVQHQSTAASVENLNLVQQGRAEVAFTLGDALSDAWKGNAEIGFPQKLDKLRAIGGLYSNYIQIVASKESGVKTLADLKGKRVSVGAPRSGTEVNARAIFTAAGLGYAGPQNMGNVLGQVQFLPFGQSVDLIKNRQLDATLISAGLGVAAIRDVASTNDIVIVAVPASMIAKIGDPAYQPGTVPAGTYRGQDAAVETVQIKNFLVTSDRVPADTVYTLTKAMFDNLDKMVAAAAAAKAIDVKTASQNTPVPLHPGAEKYYREKGLIK
ncbi:MAG: TAXI family TRAP transporter solute-binding subunit [Rhodospirillales bacterium]|nr:TAXI family TRAP transporter solute-binding subunit [Rhodospirillales bacterium]